MVIETYYTDEAHSLEKYDGVPFETYFGDCSICVLDIETTGLKAGDSHFVLGSLLSFEGGGKARLKQYFAEDVSEERRLLTEYMGETNKYDVILTYNGRGFDVPFLQSRGSALGVDTFTAPYNLDLYLILNSCSPLRKFLPNLRQKTIEDFMGLWEFREDKISGRECAMLYPTERELLLLHNRDDVLQLARLLPVLEKADFHRAMYAYGFPVVAGGRSVYVRNIKIEGNSLKASGTQASAPADYISYGDGKADYLIKFSKRTSSFEMSLPGVKKDGRVNHTEMNFIIKAILAKTLKQIPEDEYEK